MAAGKGAWIAVAALAAGAAGGGPGRPSPGTSRAGNPSTGGGKDNIGYWGDAKDFVSWDLRVDKPGTYEVEVAYSCAAGAEGSELVVAVGGASVTGTSKPTGSWATFTTEKLGMLAIDRAGTHTLTVKPKAPPPWKVIGLKSVTLVPR